MAPNQMAKLLQSGVLLRFDLTVNELLQRIVETARHVIGAQYAALAVLDDEGGIAHFVYAGLSKEDADRIGELPKGRGVLGLIIHEGKVLRLRDVRQHPKAWGFPPHHPIMRSFLGVPIFVNGKPYGRLYMTEKQGGKTFTKRDEELAKLLAAQAGAAIERAMLTERVRQAERLKRLNELLSTLNRLTDEQAILAAILAGVQKALPFAEASLCLYRAADDTFSGCVATPSGRLSQLHERWRRRPIAATRTPFLPCVRERRSVRVNDLVTPRTPFERWLQRKGFRSFIGTPISVDGEVLGLLFVAADYANAFSDDDHAFLSAVAEHAAATLKNARLLTQLQEKERVRGLLLNKVVTAQEEERRRIAHELHDQTGQLLTALLIQLQLLERELRDERRRERVSNLRRLADSIAQNLHHIAWELRPPSLDELGLTAALERMVSDWSERFQIPCDLVLDSEGDLSVSPEIAIGIYRIVQEALTNVAKHAKATRAKVTLQRADRVLRVVVEDNGVGFDPSAILRHPDETKRLGLVGMMERAAMLSGRLTVDSHPKRGTKVVLEVPLTTIPVRDDRQGGVADAPSQQRPVATA
ncbi:Redox sensor histidine kinase response regulator DevS [bacterium HR17]|uniref:histidine kinase n=1 Tax=Candidatus Fervidibacter japonicus TaxID=2035412 RepID=A0A2H5XEP7_9BACT|nr:Redox sensor histidine kinase response regulator DevS [bacterium HR17]